MGAPHFMPPTIYGTATVGTKGQIVIPAEAREAFNIQPGDKLLIMGSKERRVVCLCPVEQFEAMVAKMTENLETMRTELDKTKQDPQE